MKFFSHKAFEHLLFPLHPSVYRELDWKLQEIEQKYPDSLDSLCKMFELNFSNASTQGAIIPDGALKYGRPLFDIHIQVDESRIRCAHKCQRVKVGVLPLPVGLEEQRASCNHLIVSLKADRVHQSFIVPLPFVLQAFESRVCQPGAYQVYQHTLIRKQPAGTASPAARTITDYLAGARLYVGMTSRTWQRRAREHQNAAEQNSQLLFHRCLRGELMPVLAHEHIVLRAGLSCEQALEIEEIEVEQRSLHDLHPEGMNMIPGGKAGLRFLSTMTKRPMETIDHKEVETWLKEAVADGLFHSDTQGNETRTNSKLAALWSDDMTFRISAMTNSHRRLSHGQIRKARIWHAAGWSLEKIRMHLDGMDDRAVSLDQVQRLIDGKCYESIPHVLIPLHDKRHDAKKSPPAT